MRVRRRAEHPNTKDLYNSSLLAYQQQLLQGLERCNLVQPNNNNLNREINFTYQQKSTLLGQGLRNPEKGGHTTKMTALHFSLMNQSR
jgi:hypothetical protein